MNSPFTQSDVHSLIEEIYYWNLSQTVKIRHLFTSPSSQIALSSNFAEAAILFLWRIFESLHKTVVGHLWYRGPGDNQAEHDDSFNTWSLM